MKGEDARVGEVVSERFDGDGDNGVYFLSSRPVANMLAVIVNGRRVGWETDFLEAGEAECLVAFHTGRLRFPALKDTKPSMPARYMTVEYELLLDKTVIEAVCQHCGRGYAGDETDCRSCGALRP